MLTGVHFLLTYACNYECDHCFLHCGPHAGGTFTLDQVRRVLDQAVEIGTVTSIYYEGGEPFLYHPLLVEGLRLARERGFTTGVVSNCYWATATADAALWLEPIRDAGIDDLSLSDDDFHNPDGGESPAQRARAAAERLGISAGTICIESPLVQAPATDQGAPVVGGGALFKGRAADKLTEGLPTRSPASFTECTHEELVAPQRVHVDSFGNVHICQGVSMGNLWQTPLAQMVSAYNAAEHPICGPLSAGGPAALAAEHGIEPAGEFVDECHYCYQLRRSLVDRFPELLAPRQVYGLT